MVEIKLEALDLTSADKDTYVAVRIGESQKLSRLTSEKNYKFPQSAFGEKGDRKYGKVDIFQKIGSQSISVRYEPNVAAQEMEVPLPSSAKIPFRVTLADATPAPDATEKGSSPHLVNAKSYLAEHNLEMKLSDAMQAVLRERPANPSEFIAARLTGDPGSYKKIPPEGGAQTAGAADAKPMPNTEELRQQAKQTLLAATADGTLDSALSKMNDEKTAEGVAAAPEEAAKQAGDPDTDTLRKQAKDTLLKATADGTLNASLQDLKEKKDKDANGGAPESAEEKPAEAPATEEKTAEEKPAEEKPAEAPAAEEKPADTPAAAPAEDKPAETPAA